MTGADYSFQTDEGYSYDLNGNRTNAGYQAGGNNQLLTDGTYNYTYDDEGNRLTRTEIATGIVEEYGWDLRNRLTGIVTKDGDGNVIERVAYIYDVYNRRIGKEVDGDGDGPGAATTERYVHDRDHIALVFDGEGNLIERFLYGPGVDQVLAAEDSNGEVVWALADNE